MTNIFDLENTDDLPASMKKKVRKRAKKSKGAQMLGLLELAGTPLTTGEILAGYYRTYQKEIRPQYLSSILGALIKQGKVTRPYRGVFELTE